MNAIKGFFYVCAIMDFGMGYFVDGDGVFLIFIKEFNTGLEARLMIHI